MEHIIEWIIFAASTIGAAVYTHMVRQKGARGEKDASPLARNEKPYVIVLTILSPLVAGAIFYYGWIKRFPKKAKQANNYSIIVFMVLVGLYIIVGA